MGGNFYALDAATGQKLWGKKIGGAIGGGVITYAVNGAQKVAVATGYVSPAFPTEIRRATIAILGLEGGLKQPMVAPHSMAVLRANDTRASLPEAVGFGLEAGV